MLTLRDVTNHPDGAGALEGLRKTYELREVPNGLQLTKRDADLRLYLYEIDGVLGAARRHAQREREQEAAKAAAEGVSSKRYGPEDIISGAEDLTSARRAIAQLAEQIIQLRMTSKNAGDQHEKWKLRALLAEEALSKLSDSDFAPDPDGQRYGVLRRFLAKQFHPDYAPGTGIEKLIRGEIFKEIWGEVGRIEGR